MNPSLAQLLALVRRAPFLASCISVFVVLGVADYFLWQRLQGITSQYDEVRRNGETMFSALSSQGRVVTQLAAVEEALKHIDQNLIAETDLAENLGYFYQMETLSRVRLTQLNQLSAQPAADGSPYKAIPFSLRATGTYAQLIGFLHELESGPRQLRIKTFDFSRGEAKNNTLALGLTVELLGSP
jgi:Tfp pilus assembly protein PilO